MGLINSTNVNTSIGQSFAGTYCNVVFNTSRMLITGEVFCSLNWYKTESDYDNGRDKIYLLDNSGNKVEDSIITILPTDVIKQSGQSTMQDVINYFFQKCADKLEQDYGWTIAVS